MDLIACNSQCDIGRGYDSDSDTGEVNDCSTGDNYTLNKESFTISSHKTLEIFVGVVSVYVSPIASMNPLLEVNNASITENSLLHIINASIKFENSDAQTNTLPGLLLLVRAAYVLANHLYQLTTTYR